MWFAPNVVIWAIDNTNAELRERNSMMDLATNGDRMTKESQKCWIASDVAKRDISIAESMDDCILISMIV